MYAPNGINRALSCGSIASIASASGDYEPRAILVTGGAGFIASHVVRRLVRDYGFKVVVLDKLDYCASARNLADVAHFPSFTLLKQHHQHNKQAFPGCVLGTCEVAKFLFLGLTPNRFVKGDIMSADLVQHVLESHEIDTIMHFAAQTHVDNSFGNSLAFTMNNTYGTHVLLEAARTYGKLRRFINVSTDEVYGESSVGLADGLNEQSTLEPTNPYSAAKAGAEMMVKAYVTSYGLPCIITRGNNVYGPSQFPEKLVPKFILRARRGMDLPVHGDGLATRSYLYVEDVAEAYICILLKGQVGETYNIGTQKERSVLSVAADITRLFGTSKDRIVHVHDRAFNDRRYYICDKKLAALGWQEHTSWEEGLRKTVDWYMTHGFAAYWEHGDVNAALAAHPGAVYVAESADSDTSEATTA